MKQLTNRRRLSEKLQVGDRKGPNSRYSFGGENHSLEPQFQRMSKHHSGGGLAGHSPVRYSSRCFFPRKVRTHIATVRQMLVVITQINSNRGDKYAPVVDRRTEGDIEVTQGLVAIRESRQSPGSQEVRS